MSGWRFRVNEAGNLVAMVYVPPETGSHISYGYGERKGIWRDATVEDIPVLHPFDRPKPEFRYTPDENGFTDFPGH